MGCTCKYTNNSWDDERCDYCKSKQPKEDYENELAPCDVCGRKIPRNKSYTYKWVCCSMSCMNKSVINSCKR